MRYQLKRFGDFYGLYGNTEDEVWKSHCEFTKRPKFWLKLLGWHVGLRCDINVYQYGYNEPKS